MHQINSIGVFCGSSTGQNPLFSDATKTLGEYCAKNNITIIYGGAKVGLMGILADACLANGGRVIGVLPHFLRHKEITHPELTELHLVDTMAERKNMIIELSDAFIALPGGYGTLDELFDVLTLAQIGIHQKPIGLLNIDGYYDHLIQFMDVAISNKLLKSENKTILNVHDEVIPLIGLLTSYQSNITPKWIK